MAGNCGRIMAPGTTWAVSGFRRADAYHTQSLYVIRTSPGTKDIFAGGPRMFTRIGPRQPAKTMVEFWKYGEQNKNTSIIHHLTFALTATACGEG